MVVRRDEESKEDFMQRSQTMDKYAKKNAADKKDGSKPYVKSKSYVKVDLTRHLTKINIK